MLPRLSCRLRAMAHICLALHQRSSVPSTRKSRVETSVQGSALPLMSAPSVEFGSISLDTQDFPKLSTGTALSGTIVAPSGDSDREYIDRTDVVESSSLWHLAYYVSQ